MKREVDISGIVAFCNQYERVYCYGAGKYGKVIRVFLAERGIKLAGFIATDYLLNNTNVLELDVVSFPAFYKGVSGNCGIIVGVSEKYQTEIVDILDRNGIREYCCLDDRTIEKMDHCCSYSRQFRSDSNITVFCYHRVTDNPLDTWKLSVSPELFERQIKYIKANYHLLRSEGDWSVPDSKRGAVITFDDGYEDFCTNVVPILERNRVPATVFVCTGNIDTGQEFWWDEIERIIYYSDKSQSSVFAFGEELKLGNSGDKEKACFFLHTHLKKMNHFDRREYLADLAKRLGSISCRNYCRSMSSDQLKKVSTSPYITVGGHTVTHSCLAFETTDEQEYEIRESKETIERIINRTLDVFSYPFGQVDDFSNQTIRIAKRYGYKRIFAAFSGITNDNYIDGFIPRINIGQEKDYLESIRQLRRLETMYADA